MNSIMLNNRYRILKTIGRGGFSETFLAEDTHLPSARKCVIKQLKPAVQSLQPQPWMLERFQREAAILEQLGEANSQIPRLYAYFTEKTNFYLIQEWIEGQTLTQKYQQEGNLQESEVQNILIHLLPVLQFVHDKRIVHRDIKPDNIILRESDQKPVLIDFGAVKEAMATVVNLHSGVGSSIVIGTPGYMSSEQAAGRPVYSSDLYSLGLTAVYLLCGKSPEEIKIDQRSGELMWQREVPNISLNLGTVLDNVIRFHPRDRYASAREMLQALIDPQNSYSRVKTMAVDGTRKVTKERKFTSKNTQGEELDKDGGWKIPLLLSAFVAGSAFVIGYSMFSGSSNKPQPKPIFTEPPPVTTTPTPEISPTPTSEPIPYTPPPTRRPIPPQPEPIPTQEPTPIPEVVPTLTPEPTPTEEPTPIPEVPATPIPVPTPDSTSIPEIPPTVEPIPGVTPTPEVSPTTEPVPTPTVQQSQ